MSAFQKGDGFFRLAEIGIFGTHVEKIRLVGFFRTIADGIFDNDGNESVRNTIDAGRPDSA